MPPPLQFHVVTPRPVVINKAALIDYRLKIHGVPVAWRTQITEWDPPRFFVDTQRRGPYKAWLHRHMFVAQDNGTLCLDDVDSSPPVGW